VAPMACVDLPAFPLQILLRKHPQWRGLPAAVVAEDKPQGLILWVNEEARASRVLSGMRYAAGLSLTRELRAGVISPAEIEQEIAEVIRRLRFFSPEVEPSHRDPGTFWLGAEGLDLLHPSLRRWGEMIRSELASIAYEGRVAVGFTHFGSYAAARAAGPRDVIVFHDSEQERSAVRRIPIERISCDPDFRDSLARLGIDTLGGFLDLPPAGIRRRFGEGAYALHRLASGEGWSPLRSEPEEVPVEARVIFDQPENDTARVLESAAGLLEDLLARLRRRERALCGLLLEMSYDRSGPHGERGRTERIRPAKPTRDGALLIDLLRLRLESVELPSGVADLKLSLEWIAATAEQIGLFLERPRRDLEAANRALARVRAEFGEQAVCAARLREAHLPEARFALEPMEALPEAQPRKILMPPLVRRILIRPEGLGVSPPRAAHSGFGGTPAREGLSPSPAARTTVDGGAIEETIGPYVVSGGWWRRAVTREYWYVLTQDATWLWIYYDARRRRWFRHGEVE
jgi:protein ImuB